MKLRLRRLGRVYALIGLGVLGLSMGGTIVSVFNPEIAYDRDAMEKIRRLKYLDTELSLLTMRVRHSLAASYDPVVAMARAMADGNAGLLAGDLAVSHAGVATRTAREAAVGTINRKLQLVEDFKSSFAVLRNSIALLSVLAGDLGEIKPRSEQDAEVHRRATILLLAMSRLFMDGSAEQTSGVERARMGLAGSAAGDPTLRDIVDRILAQADLARRHRGSVDARVSELLALPVADRLDELRVTYAHHLNQNDTRRRGFVLALISTALITVVVAIDGLRNQRQTRMSLEQRVEERTRALAEANATLTRASRAKTEFLANMSHEIRTPLAAILGFADLLEGDRLKDGERREIARIIRHNGEHLLAILSDILDITKIEAGKLTVEEIPCSPRQIAEEVCTFLRNRAEAKGLILRLRVDADDFPRQIESDPTRIRQILVNLIGNAIKFTERGNVTVILGVERRSGSPWLRFEVRDTGIGIPAEAMARIFADFEQADSSTTRRFGGTGLGLAICRRLTSVLGGEITVRSERNKGSTFVLMLPVEESSEIVQDLEDTAIIAPRGLPPRRGLRVLIADDSADIQLLVTRFLADIDAEVAVVSNGRQAVETALTALREERAFDIILMDLHMPELDGAEAVRTLRTAGINQPMIALTASAYPEDRERCAKAGYSDFLSKPIDRAELIQKIATHSGVRHGGADKAGRLPSTRDTGRVAVPGVSSPYAVFDGDRLLAMVGGDHSVRDAVLGLFRGDAPALLETIQAAVTTGDHAGVRASAHRLKGMLLTVCANDAADAATDLETAARAGQGQHFEQLTAVLRAEITKVCESMASAAQDDTGRAPAALR
jgi:signal transduction histidine kinase/HPt (histidine-containing phosphotransfer) domain-containing protein/ActR/RegA family two-component response regulator